MTVSPTVAISNAHASLIEEVARAARPYECCGVLIGRRNGTNGTVTDVVRLRNSDIRPARFSIPDVELRRARRVAQELESEVVAIFHSHAGRAVLSDQDRAAIAYSAYPWVIVGFDDRDGFEIAAFGASSGESLPVHIELHSGRY